MSIEPVIWLLIGLALACAYLGALIASLDAAIRDLARAVRQEKKK